MSLYDRARVAQAVLGEGQEPVYPGHPLTLALFIMYCYPSLRAAQARDQARVDGYTSYGFSAASRDDRIPGAGGNVGTALQLLSDLQRGRLDGREYLIQTQRAWEGCDDQKVKYPERWREGQDQADSLESAFRARIDAWLAVDRDLPETE